MVDLLPGSTLQECPKYKSVLCLDGAYSWAWHLQSLIFRYKTPSLALYFGSMSVTTLDLILNIN